jgi:probable rRNA maturation factor
MALTVYVIGAVAADPIPESQWERWFDTWASHMAIDGSQELTLKFTDDAEMTVLNRTYRHQEGPTDVLAFAALEVPVPPIACADATSEPVYLGDVVIAVPTASRQAAEQGHSLPRELVWLAAHGFLHLLGWDHPDEARLREMLAQQETLLDLLPCDFDSFTPVVLP